LKPEFTQQKRLINLQQKKAAAAAAAAAVLHCEQYRSSHNHSALVQTWDPPLHVEATTCKQSSRVLPMLVMSHYKNIECHGNDFYLTVRAHRPHELFEHSSEERTGCVNKAPILIATNKRSPIISLHQ
jgi:hypothetical protein